MEDLLEDREVRTKPRRIERRLHPDRHGTTVSAGPFPPVPPSVPTVSVPDTPFSTETAAVRNLAPDMSEFVYSMYRANKFYGADRQVLADISLSFFHGAKIGVLGPNGAGQVDAAPDHGRPRGDLEREAQLAPGATVGLLEQEPELDPAKDVRGNVEDGVRELRDLLDRFNAISAAFAEPDADYDALLAEQAKVQDEIDRRDAWSLDATLDRAMDALRLPEGDRDVTTLSGGERRRVALCRLLLSAPDLLLLDEPTNHLDAESVYWLERFLADYKGAVIAVTHDRYFLDNVAGWILELDRGRGIPFQGNYSSWLEQKQERLAVRGEERVGPPPHARPRARVGAHEPERAAREVEGPPRRLRAAARRRGAGEARPRRDPHPARPAARRRRDRGGRRSTKGFGDRLLFEDLTFSLPPAGIVGVIGPNGAGKTTLFRLIAGEEQPDARLAPARRHGRSSPTSTSRAATSTRRTPSGRRSAAATT